MLFKGINEKFQQRQFLRIFRKDGCHEKKNSYHDCYHGSRSRILKMGTLKEQMFE